MTHAALAYSTRLIPLIAPQNLSVARPRLESLVQPVHAKELVGRVKILVGGGEREEHGVQSHLTLEDFAYGHRAAHPDDQRMHAVHRCQRGVRGAKREMIRRNSVRTRTVSTTRTRRCASPLMRCVSERNNSS